MPPEYCNRRITYLKIVATITSFQSTDREVTILDQLRNSYEGFYGIEAFYGQVARAFPCYGALLQVALHPRSDEDVPAHDYPYISAMQPRKREMYEVVSESGEMASQSASKLNVLKAATNTGTTEDYDLDLGGGGGNVLFGAASWNLGQKQEGTVQRVQKQDQDVTTTDASREKREAFAYSTSLNQLYTLLQSYHLGTNRAVFFMEPRPHIQESKFTFVQGLRRLEGIQEFFLIVNRPATVPGICVEVALETAHLYADKTYHPRLIPAGDLALPGLLDQTAGALGLNLDDYPTHRDLVQEWNSCHTWIRQLAVREVHEAESFPLWRMVEAGEISADLWARVVQVASTVPEIGVDEVGLVFDDFDTHSGTVFVTGRKLCACVTPQHHEDEPDCEVSRLEHVSECTRFPSVTYWKPTDVAIAGPRLRWSYASSVNSFAQQVSDSLTHSIGNKDRHPYGEVDFLSTEFVLDDLAQVVRQLRTAGIGDRKLADIEEIQDAVKGGLGRTSGARTVTDLGKVSTRAIARDLGVSVAQARKVRRTALVAGLGKLDFGTVKTEPEQVNSVKERFEFQYPPERLRRLRGSARVFVGKPTKGTDLHYGDGLLRRICRFLFH
ncbi:hypothetical protein ACW9HS_18110 [Nocardia gipuzkoensis]